jgi:hypothetical protein
MVIQADTISQMPEIVVTKRDGSIIRAQVSEEDSDLTESRWYMSGGKGGGGKYLARTESRTTFFLHRVVAHRMGLIEDFRPTGTSGGNWAVSIDHINGDKLDNRRENLRLATRREQSMNPSDPLSVRNTSGYRGVHFTKATQKWSAQIGVAHRQVYLGQFETIEEAIEARRIAEMNPPLPAPRRVPQGCGTNAGRIRHLRRGEEPCDACRTSRRKK